MGRHSFKNYKYGPHERNVFDFYPAQSDEPTPQVIARDGSFGGRSRVVQGLSQCEGIGRHGYEFSSGVPSRRGSN